MPFLSPGQTLLNQYQIETFVTLTPLGELYRATDTRSNKPLALTLLPKTISENIEKLKHLEAEAARLRSISHPNIVPFLGLYQTPTTNFLLEEWVNGPSLVEILARPPLSATEALVYTKAICAALEALHKQNYLHLNLIPEFIHINKRGEILVSGISAAQQINAIIEYPHGKYLRLYVSPEQFTNQKLTPASDIYSLAAILYTLITGAWINGKSAPKTNAEIKKAHLDLTPPAPITLNKEIPDHFSRMILWALRKNPENRLKTTTELLSSLALATQSSVDQVPLRTDPKTAPVTSAVLEGWNFLPPPKPNIITEDSLPLEERMTAIAQPKKRRSGMGIMTAFVVVLLLGFASLFWLVRPAPVVIPTPIQFTPFAADFTPPPTFTPEPRPTDPHGGRIAFTCTRGDYNQVCIVNRDGSGYTQLSDMDASSYYPAFTPDGSSLLFASNRNGAFDLYLLQFGQKQLTQLTQNIGNVVSPDYSTDGQKIIFVNQVGDSLPAIWMVNADGLNPHLVYAGVNEIVAVTWSPDMSQIAYAMSTGAPLEYEIYVMNSDGREHRQVSRGLQGIGGSLDWSPDGKSLLIYAGPFGDKDIFSIDIASGNFTQLTDGGNNAGASYSPDGLYIVFNSLRNDEQADLYIMRVDGSNQIQLTNHPEPDWGPRWVE